MRKAMLTLLALLLVGVFTAWLGGPSAAQSQYPDEFIKFSMPDFGQHSQNWCWAAALANSLYWYAKQRGYTQLLDDVNNPGFDQDLGDVDPATGRLKLLNEIARVAGIPFSNPIPSKSAYLNAIQRFLDQQGASLRYNPSAMQPLYIHDIVDYEWDWEHEWAGPVGPPPPPYNPPVDPLVGIEVRHPTFEDYRREIYRSQDVLLWLWPPGGGFGHIVTAVGWRWNPATGRWQVIISDPFNQINNNDPLAKNYDYYDVLDLNKLTIDYPSDQKEVRNMIFVSPVPEPGSLAATLMGLAALVSLRSLRRPR